jgi:hypothetical protein
MGRTRRSGRTPATTTARITYDIVDRLDQLKRNKVEPLWQTMDRACTALEEYTDMQETIETIRQNIPKLQKRLTEKSTDVCNFIELLPKDALESLLSDKNRSRFSEDTIIEIRKVLSVLNQ